MDNEIYIFRNIELSIRTIAGDIISDALPDRKDFGYWSKSEANLLEALIIYVCDRNNSKEVSDGTLHDIYCILSTDTIEDIRKIYNNLHINSPANPRLRLFFRTDETVQKQIAGGLAEKLSRYAEEVKK